MIPYFKKILGVVSPAEEDDIIEGVSNAELGVSPKKEEQDKVIEEYRLWKKSLGWAMPVTPISAHIVKDDIFSLNGNLLDVPQSTGSSLLENSDLSAGGYAQEDEINMKCKGHEKEKKRLKMELYNQGTLVQSFFLQYPKDYSTIETEKKSNNKKRNKRFTSDGFIIGTLDNKTDFEWFVKEMNRFINENSQEKDHSHLTITSILSYAVELYSKNKFQSMSTKNEDEQNIDEDDVLFQKYKQLAQKREEKCIKEDINDSVNNIPQSEEYKTYIIKQLSSLVKEQTGNEADSPFLVRTMGDNPYVWLVNFRYNASSILGKDLIEYNKKYNITTTDLFLTTEIRFTQDFVLNSTLPQVRVIRPRLEYLTGNVQFNGLVCMDANSVYNVLSKVNSNGSGEKVKMKAILALIRDFFIQNGARIDMRTPNPYSYEIVKKHLMNKKYTKAETRTTFRNTFFTFSVDFATKLMGIKGIPESFEHGNRIILPPSAAKKIFESNDIPLPLMFEIKTSRMRFYCGSLEFTAPESKSIFPSWMLKSMFLKEGEKVEISCVNLPIGSFCTIQPHSKSFYTIKNHKAVLEKALRNFTTLNEGTSIPLSYGGKIHMIEIVELKPQSAVSIIAEPYLDLKLDFLPAIDYDEDEEGKKETIETSNDKQKSDEQDDAPPQVVGVIPQVPQTIQEGVQYVQCENCKRSVPEMRYMMHIVQCQKHCYFCAKCKQVVRLSEKQNHDKEIACKECNKNLLVCELEIHMQNSCISRMVQCQYCNDPYPHKNLQQHEDKCGSTTSTCDQCGQYYLVKDFFLHVSICPGPGSVSKSPTSYDDSYSPSPSSSSSSSFTEEFNCPYPSCGFPGLTVSLLIEHVTSVHSSDSTRVVCPICASLPGGDPNKKSQDFKGHLDLRHKNQ